jgi:hypothetical protein
MINFVLSNFKYYEIKYHTVYADNRDGFLQFKLQPPKYKKQTRT